MGNCLLVTLTEAVDTALAAIDCKNIRLGPTSGLIIRIGHRIVAIASGKPDNTCSDWPPLDASMCSAHLASQTYTLAGSCLEAIRAVIVERNHIRYRQNQWLLVLTVDSYLFQFVCIHSGLFVNDYLMGSPPSSSTMNWPQLLIQNYSARANCFVLRRDSIS